MVSSALTSADAKSLQILHALRADPGLSKSDLARRLRVSPATAGQLVGGLLERGLVVTSGHTASGLGRPAERLTLNGQAPLVLGVDLSDSAIRLAVVNLAGEILSRDTVPFPESEPGREAADVVALIAAHAAALPTPVSRIGLAVPGVLDAGRRVVRRAVNLGWRDVQLAQLLAAYVDVPVSMEQHREAALLAEQWWGAARLADSAVLLMLGAGVGVGVMVGGALVRGASGVAGEIGHVPIDLDGPRCACGLRGCLELYAGGPALCRRYAELRGDPAVRAEPVTVGTVARAARDGDAAALDALAVHGRYVGQAVVMLLNILNPEVVILGDQGMEAGDLLLSHVRAFVAAHGFSDAADSAEIKASSLGSDGSLVGAATVAIAGVFGEAAVAQR
jgi:predicted NBD/HSP70 family sugar kinase